MRGLFGSFIFSDRKDAGARLAGALLQRDLAEPVVLALPRGGVPVAFEVAKALEAPLDLVFVRKIGAPDQPELAVAAVANGDHPEMVVNEEVREVLGLDQDFLERRRTAELEVIAARRERYLGERKQPSLAGRTAILIDDGIATGATTRAALRSVRRRGPASVILAVPVAPRETVTALERAREADEVVCLAMPEPFGAIGAFYADFRQTSDEEVVDLLRRAGA